jgi:hypothetical protein
VLEGEAYDEDILLAILTEEQVDGALQVAPCTTSGKQSMMLCHP